MNVSKVRVTWVIIDMFDGGPPTPDISRTCAVTEDGRVFVNAGIGGPTAALCAMHDGQPLMSHEGHTFVDVEWLMEHSPIYGVGLRRIRDAVLQEHRPAPL